MELSAPIRTKPLRRANEKANGNAAVPCSTTSARSTTVKPRRSRNAIIELHYAGWTPSKKNCLRPARGGGGRFYYPDNVREAMDDIYRQLDSQWRDTVVTDAGPVDTPRPPLADPAIAFVWYVSTRGTRSDRDGALTTVLDEMVKVGILRDDSISSWNGPCLLANAVVTDGWAGCRIFIEPRGNAGKLWRYLANVPDLTTCRLQKSVPGGFRLGTVRRWGTKRT